MGGVRRFPPRAKYQQLKTGMKMTVINHEDGEEESVFLRIKLGEQLSLISIHQVDNARTQ